MSTHEISFGNSLDTDKPEEAVFQPLIVGLLLDISLQHHSDGRRYLDITKEELVKWLMTLETDDRALVWPQLVFPPRIGATVAQVSSYETPVPFPLKTVFEETLAVVGVEDRDAHKYVVYITDRYNETDAYPVQRSFIANETKRYRTTFVFIGLGKYYDRSLANIGGKFCHLNEPQELFNAMQDLVKGG